MSVQAGLRQRLARLIRENAGLKLFSLVVSIGLFTAVHGSEAGQRSLYVPVVALLPGKDSGKILINDIPDKVKVTLSGSRSVLNSVDAMEVVQIDLTDARRYYYFDSAQFGLPAGIDVSVSPSVLALQWEDRLSRKLPVRAQLAGAPNAALDLVHGATTSPSEVVVTGPRSSVELMNEVLTEPLLVSELTAGKHRRRLPLLPMPKLVQTDGVQDVLVEVVLVARREQRRLRRVPVTALGTSEPFALRPLHVDLIVAVPEPLADEVDPEHIVPVVDLSDVDFTEGVSVPVQVRVPSDEVEVVRIEPPEVLVKPR